MRKVRIQYNPQSVLAKCQCILFLHRTSIYTISYRTHTSSNAQFIKTGAKKQIYEIHKVMQFHLCFFVTMLLKPVTKQTAQKWLLIPDGMFMKCIIISIIFIHMQQKSLLVYCIVLIKPLSWWIRAMYFQNWNWDMESFSIWITTDWCLRDPP